LNTKEPKILVERLNKTTYINKRKPHKANFLDRSLLKIGQQSLNNRISSMTFPIKKRINTELFIDGKQGLYIQRDQIMKTSDL